MKGAVTGKRQPESSPVLPRQPGHPRAPPQPLSSPVLCCAAAGRQNSVWIKSQVNKDHQPVTSLIHSDCNSPTNTSHKTRFVLFPFFKFSIYLSFLPPSQRVMLGQAVFSSTARPPDQHPHHQHPAKSSHRPCLHPSCLGWYLPAALILHPSHTKGKQR